jgi:uncharacterized protein (TIGR02453 family)
MFKFLKELDSNNDREWWGKNKDRYNAVVRDPALEFINDFAPHLAKISSNFAADSRTVGGSLMRPYRDTRFSADKTPYKTNVGIQFRHKSGKDIHAPGLYLHIEPGACFAGVGLWHPETATARQIRQAIADDIPGWTKAAKSKGFIGTWSTAQDPNDTLKRVPREFDENHPHADDLRMKSFIAGTDLSQKVVTAPGFDRHLAGMFVKARDFTRFLCDAVGVLF